MTEPEYDYLKACRNDLCKAADDLTKSLVEFKRVFPALVPQDLLSLTISERVLIANAVLKLRESLTEGKQI